MSSGLTASKALSFYISNRTLLRVDFLVGILIEPTRLTGYRVRGSIGRAGGFNG